jgi:hypothetical protein
MQNGLFIQIGSSDLWRDGDFFADDFEKVLQKCLLMFQEYFQGNRPGRVALQSRVSIHKGFFLRLYSSKARMAFSTVLLSWSAVNPYSMVMAREFLCKIINRLKKYKMPFIGLPVSLTGDQILLSNFIDFPETKW